MLEKNLQTKLLLISQKSPFHRSRRYTSKGLLFAEKTNTTNEGFPKKPVSEEGEANWIN